MVPRLLLLLLSLLLLDSAALPRFNLVKGSTTVSGISSGADMAVQYFVANSASVRGMAVFAGEAFSCAVLRFSGDNLTQCQNQPPKERGPGCVSGDNQIPAPCIGCPAHTTIRYDHCKNEPALVSADVLRAHLHTLASHGLIDDPENMRHANIFLYKGTKDAIYLNTSVSMVGESLRPFLDSPDTQIKYESNIASTHAWPTLDYGSPCGFPSKEFAPALQKCDYDGAGEALQFMFGGSLTPPAPDAPRQGEQNVTTVNQEAFFGTDFPGMASTGYLYAPSQCLAGKECRLHIALHGCTMYALNPAMGRNFTIQLGFNRWADANNFVVLYPQSGGYVEFAERYKTTSFQQETGCWDSYGQTGALYATKKGLQMATIARMVQALGAN